MTQSQTNLRTEPTPIDRLTDTHQLPLPAAHETTPRVTTRRPTQERPPAQQPRPEPVGVSLAGDPIALLGSLPVLV